jgi:phage replication O-like protein O
METLQLGGYTRIPHELLEKLFTDKWRLYEMKVILVVARKTFGYNKLMDRLSDRQIAKMTGIDHGNVNRTVNSLIKREILKVAVPVNSKRVRKLGIQLDYGRWRDGSTKTGGAVPRDSRVLCHDTAKALCQETASIEKRNLGKERDEDGPPASGCAGTTSPSLVDRFVDWQKEIDDIPDPALQSDIQRNLDRAIAQEAPELLEEFKSRLA